jgi:nucleoside-triphosphatase THEP1
MTSETRISDIWIKASILGTIWAASEIVLGSFMHNLKIPFSSNILTMIGLVILISVSYIWSEKGLYWRAGLICAIMKTMSPSAVIFGPMIAIFSQAVLLEFSTRVFGKNYFGFVFGAMLAMTWNLFHKILKYIILYGFNIVDLYEDLLRFTQKQLQITFDILWLPILILLIVYCILGLIAAIIGMRVGKKLITQTSIYNPTQYNNAFSPNKETTDTFQYSTIWLIINILLIIFSLILINFVDWKLWTPFVILVVILWAKKYKRAIRQLSKPKFWIFFVVITMLSALIITLVKEGNQTIYDGLLIGLEMNFRAAIIVVGFAVLGTELYNPKIRNYFSNTKFKQLPLALELSFDSLPAIISSIPDFNTIVKNPTNIMVEVISQVEYRLDEIKSKIDKKQSVFIITGDIGSGKTSTIKQLIKEIKRKGLTVAGIYSQRIMEQNETIGYDIIDIKSNVRGPFLRLSTDSTLDTIGKYQIFKDGLKLGESTLSEIADTPANFIIIDEVGKLETKGEGWSENLKSILKNKDSKIIISVRNSFINDVVTHFKIENYTVLEIENESYESIRDAILN